MNEVIEASELDASGGGWRAAIVAALLAVLGAGLLYPVLAVSVAGRLFPAKARGSLIEHEGRVIGSALMAQAFVDDRYFSPRPSAANYAADTLAGSNWAPSNPALRERAAAETARVAAREGIAPAQVPVELISASGSGIDPHLSPAGAMIQAPRVARARGVPVPVVIAAVEAHTERRTWGVFGQPRVNVLALNRWLDESLRTVDDAGHARPASESTAP